VVARLFAMGVRGVEVFVRRHLCRRASCVRVEGLGDGKREAEANATTLLWCDSGLVNM
jgi:hypothetical protein